MLRTYLRDCSMRGSQGATVHLILTDYLKTNRYMIYSIYLFLLITWMVNQLAIEFYDGNFKKLEKFGKKTFWKKITTDSLEIYNPEW